MQKILNQSHDKHTWLFAFSRLFERTAYYGIRALVVIYLLHESIGESEVKALSIYGWFTGSILLSKIIGAVIGDLVTGNKHAIIIGAFLQVLGALALCFGHIYGIYIGLFLVSIGSGFYIPNMEARFGKMYLDRPKLLDSGYVILWLFVNIGAALGTVTIAILGESDNWVLAFIVAAVCFIISLILFTLSNRQGKFRVIGNPVKYSSSALLICITLLVISIFWIVKQIALIKHSAFQFVENVEWEVPTSLLLSMDSVFVLLLSIIISIVWSRFYRSTFVKIGIGLILGLLAFGIILFLPEQFTMVSVIGYVIALILLSLAQLYIEPVMQSYIVRNANPKYLAIILSVAFVPGRYLANYLPFVSDYFIDNSQIGVILALITTAILIVFIYLGPFKKETSVDITDAS